MAGWVSRALPRYRRWLVPPALVLAGLPLLGLGHGLLAAGVPRLPPATAAGLVSALIRSDPSRSGTVRVTSDLGLPQLPGGDAAGGLLGALASGSATLRWWQGPGRLRLALLGRAAESDLVVRGNHAFTWSWDTATVRAGDLLPRRGSGAARAAGGALGSGPGGLLGGLLGGPLGGLLGGPLGALASGGVADALLAALAPSTVVSVGPAERVAGRAAYRLWLAPRQPESLVRRVEVALDAATGVPLSVGVWARGQAAPALQASFTSISFGPVPASVFDVAAPPGARVAPLAGLLPGGVPGGGVRLLGHGWLKVLALRAGPGQVMAGLPAALRLAMRPWHGGRLLSTSLLDAYLAPGGTLYLGAVTPAALAAAAS